MGQHISDFDYTNFDNEKIIGEGWYRVEMQKNSSISDTFSIPYLYNQQNLNNIRDNKRYDIKLMAVYLYKCLYSRVKGYTAGGK